MGDHFINRDDDDDDDSNNDNDDNLGGLYIIETE